MADTKHTPEPPNEDHLDEPLDVTEESADYKVDETNAKEDK